LAKRPSGERKGPPKGGLFVLFDKIQERSSLGSGKERRGMEHEYSYMIFSTTAAMFIVFLLSKLVSFFSLKRIPIGLVVLSPLTGAFCGQVVAEVMLGRTLFLVTLFGSSLGALLLLMLLVCYWRWVERKLAFRSG
jgi:hypothetical protein